MKEEAGLQKGNVYLMEIDKGFRSSNPGEQLECVAKLPLILQTVPLPIFINSAFLKLADLFRHSSSNAVRAHITSVIEKCGREYIPKVRSKAEFLSKLESVLHSNDPVARSLALRSLSCCAVIGQERVSCHHVIRTALDSCDEAEVEAAIHAAKPFAKFSKSFSNMILPKIQSMLDCVGTSPDHIWQLVSVLEFTGHDLESCARTVDVLLGYTSTYTTSPLLHHILRVASKASRRRRVLCERVIGELLDHAMLDERESVQLECLRCLLAMARRVPHCWHGDTHVALLCNYFLDNMSAGNEAKTIATLKVLTNLPLSTLEPLPSFSAVIDHCETLAYTSCDEMSVHALSLFARTKDVESILPLTQLLITSAIEQSSQHSLVPQDLSLLDEISSRSNDWSIIQRITKFLVTTLSDSLLSERDFPSNLCLLFLRQSIEYVVKLKSNVSSAEFTKFGVGIVKCVRAIPLGQFDVSLLPQVAALHFACCATTDAEAGNYLHELISRSASDWMTYRLIRTLMRFGHYHLATPCVKLLMEHSESETVYVWLRVLQLISEAESRVTSSLGDAISAYQSAVRAVGSFSSCSAVSHPKSCQLFQKLFLQLRFEHLCILKQLRDLVSFHRKCRLPRLAHKLAAADKPPHLSPYLCSDTPGRFGRVCEQLRRLSAAYHTLEGGMLDGDACSVVQVGRAQRGVSLLATCVHSLFLPHIPLSVRIPEAHELQDERSDQTELTIRRIVNGVTNVHHVGEQHYDAMDQIISHVLHSHLPIPRFFFQSVQTTSVSLVLSPAPKSSCDPVSVYCGGDKTTLTIEGVIDQTSNFPKLQRRITKAVVTCNLKLTAAASVVSQKLGAYPGPEVQSSTASVDKGYFTCQLLVEPPVPGMYTAEVSVALRDESGSGWSCGTSQCLVLKAIEKTVAP